MKKVAIIALLFLLFSYTGYAVPADYLSGKAAPNAPTNLTAERLTSHQILLTWTDNSTDELGFKIERRIGADPWVDVGISAANFAIQAPWLGTLSYIDESGVLPGTIYEYRILAYNRDNEESSYSNTATAAKTYDYGDFYEYDNILDSNLRYIPATGECSGFMQGSPDTEDCRFANEGPQFEHILTRSLVVMPTEVTRQMWADLKAVQVNLPNDPTLTTYSTTMDHPVQNITWFETIIFANLLSVQQGYDPVYYKDEDLTTVVDHTNYSNPPIYMDFYADGYRLPTEGEWEHFARAGTTTPFSINEPSYDDTTCDSEDPTVLPFLASVAVYKATTGRNPMPVAQKGANPWGLYDVHGNVWEYCWDLYGDYPDEKKRNYLGDPDGSSRVIRGGRWVHLPYKIRSAVREGQPPATRSERVGFRLVRSIVHNHVYTRDPIVGNMIYVPETGPQGFMQGAPDGEHCAYDREKPQFIHRLTRKILVMETEVSRHMWERLRTEDATLPADPSYADYTRSLQDPVNTLTFREAVLFANLLSLENGFTRCYYADDTFTTPITASNYETSPIYCNWDATGYRLPSEGEWEYFTRAGTTGTFSIEETEYGSTSYPCDYGNTSTDLGPDVYPALDCVATFRFNSYTTPAGWDLAEAKTRPVGSKAPNPWKIHDVHGNVWERCWDGYSEKIEPYDYPHGTTSGIDGTWEGLAMVTDWIAPSTRPTRVIRGGGLWSRAEHLRSAVRFSYKSYTAYGFRLVRTITITKTARKAK